MYQSEDFKNKNYGAMAETIGEEVKAEIVQNEAEEEKGAGQDGGDEEEPSAGLGK